MTNINFSIDCQQDDSYTVKYSTSADFSPENDAILTTMLYALRQASNLKENPASHYLGGALCQLSEEGMAYFSDDQKTRLNKIMTETKKRFVGNISYNTESQHMNFKMNASGFGFFSKGIEGEAIMSTLFLTFFFLQKFKSDSFRNTYLEAIGYCGAYIMGDEVTLTNQNNIAVAIMKELDLW
jgi:hypothetical protein